MLLSFKITKQIITRTDTEKPVADSKNYLSAEFELPSDWEGNITAVFSGEDGCYSQILDYENKCTVPWETIKAPGFSVSCFCGELITANTVFVPVIESGYEEGETPVEPTPDVYSQLTSMVQDAIDTADSVREDADNGVFDGAPGTTDYTELINQPRTLYTPSSANVSYANFSSGVYDIGESFTLTGIDSGVFISKGAVLSIKVNSFGCSGAVLGDTDKGVTVFKKDVTGKTFVLENLLNYNLANFVDKTALAQTTGNGTQAVMSQDAVSTALAGKQASGDYVTTSQAEQMLQSVKQNFSTEEQVIGTWIDGKPLYEKTIKITGINVVTYKTAISAYIQNFDWLIVKTVSAYSGDGFCTQYFINGGDCLVVYVDNSNRICFASGSSYPTKPYTCIVTLQYTKTTDTAEQEE